MPPEILLVLIELLRMVACDEHNGIVGKTRLLDSCEYLVNHHVNLITAVAIEIIIGCRVYIIVELGIVGKQ